MTTKRILELEVGPHSGPYLLVYLKTNFTIVSNSSVWQKFTSSPRKKTHWEEQTL